MSPLACSISLLSSPSPLPPRCSPRRGSVAARLEAGELLYVPTWWWHRVDYLPGATSATLSLFHVRPRQMLGHNALYAAVLLPNLLKELVGWKTQ